MGPPPVTPAADISKLMPGLSTRDHQAPLGARDPHEERTTDFVGVPAPIGLLLYAEQDDRVELQALALVDGQYADRLVIR